MKRPLTFRPVTYPVAETLPQRMRAQFARNASCIVQKYRKDGGIAGTSYAEFWKDILGFAVSLKRSGVKRGDHVGIISDNRREWMRADLALLSIGAIDVPRGADTTESEIVYILGHADCGLVIAENRKLAERIIANAASIPSLKSLILIDDTGMDGLALPAGIKVDSFWNLVVEGRKAGEAETAAVNADIDSGKPEDVATLIYTSGTTGEPKGVLLPHRSFVFQVDNIYNYLHIGPGDVAILVLPVWHCYERAVEYIILDRGLTMVYSKPVGSFLLDDMATFKPTILPAVPRLMEAVMQGIFRAVNKGSPVKRALFRFFLAAGGAYAHCRNLLLGQIPALKPRSRFLDIIAGLAGVSFLWFWKFMGHLLVFRTLHEKFGGKFLCAIIGGGALAPNVDAFYQAIGIMALEGYGLTETGPILAVREMHHPVSGTIGPVFPLAKYQVRAVDGDEVLGPGEKGVLWVNSTQNMYGYYKREEDTKKVLRDGWLNTGDLAVYTHGKIPYVKILGRIKDTIVLSGGKNVEPEPIELKLNAHPLILQSMVVGQDRKFLSVLVVPNQDNVLAWAKSNGIGEKDYDKLVAGHEFGAHITGVVLDIVSKKNGFKNYELIHKVGVVSKAFEPGKEMTQSLKIKRHVVAEKYATLIGSLFD